MSAIKIHLDDSEYDAVRRLAEFTGTQPEDIAYCALNRMMLSARDKEVQDDIRLTLRWRRDNLPLWSDTAGSVHAYEGMHDVDSVKSKYSI